MRRMTRGFTIIELLVVISVIGILATITLVGFNRYQADARDAQRSSQATIISEALEKYYDKNGEYPSCATMTNTGTVVASTLTGTDPKVLVAPKAATNQTNSIDLCQTLAYNYPTDSFAYVGDGSTSCSTGTSCLSYSLQYKEESTGTVKTISSRRTADIMTSGDITDLSATAFSFSQANLTWTGVSGAATYNIQWHVNTNDFTTPTGTSTSTSAGTNVGGLTLGTVYYFRVQPVSATGATGKWSNIDNTTTYTLDTPTGTVIADPAAPASQLKFTWNNNIANATSYTVEYSDNSSFATSPSPKFSTVVPSASMPYYVTSLPAGTTRYFRVKSVAATYTSGWSATVSAITQVPTPTCSTNTKTSNTSITPAWAAVANATSYTLEYATNSGFTGATSITGITGTSRTVTGLNNGTTYYARVTAFIGASSGNAGTCPSVATGVDGPTSVGWSGRGDAVRCYTCVSWMPGQDPGYGSTWWTVGMYITGTCQPGATVVTRLYSYYAYSNGTSANNASLMDWTWGTQERYMVDGNDSWYGWFQGWVACQVGSTRAGDTYLGNAGPY